MSRHHRALSGAHWERTRQRALERAGRRCERCGRPGRLEVHHKTALEDGGAPYAPDNLRVLCRDCHLAEHHDDPERAAWRAFLNTSSL